MRAALEWAVGEWQLLDWRTGERSCVFCGVSGGDIGFFPHEDGCPVDALAPDAGARALAERRALERKARKVIEIAEQLHADWWAQGSDCVVDAQVESSVVVLAAYARDLRDALDALDGAGREGGR